MNQYDYRDVDHDKEEEGGKDGRELSRNYHSQLGRISPGWFGTQCTSRSWLD